MSGTDLPQLIAALSRDRPKGMVLQDNISGGRKLRDRIHKNMHDQGIETPPSLERAAKNLSDARDTFGVWLKHDEKAAAAAASHNLVSSAFHKIVAAIRFREASKLEKKARYDMEIAVFGSREDHGFDPRTGDSWP